MKRRIFTSLLLAGLLANASVMAQTSPANSYPNRAVKIVVPFPPGGTADVLPRILAQRLSEIWRQPVIIENRPGAGGNLGADAVAKSAPDGYTLLASPPGPLAINQSLYKSMPYKPEQFTPITILAAVPNVLATRTTLPVASVKDFIAYAKQEAGRVKMATQGNGTTSHLTSAMFAAQAGVEFVYVPYKGTAPALTDLVGGQVDAFFDNIGSMQGQHNAGKARVLATAGRKRSPLLPDVPTLSEAGLPGFESGAWFGLVAPPDTPPEIAQKINAAVRDVMKSKEIQQKFLEQGAEIIGNSPQEMTEFVNGERMRWKKVVDSANVVLN